eukprot:CAMPEP_0175167512 /NCGR_PEP_ID=MMETSP0087-20121206/28392_1 /TAXON_ID=136419 /ORGANISM="Unknown Unknown, Strain D1" /LENGTH=261 /DNA_ID=CAMNT_0016457427 /DNA_START=38 /DNA_END=823 /DNA_ORIENTATION=+
MYRSLMRSAKRLEKNKQVVWLNDLETRPLWGSGTYCETAAQRLANLNTGANIVWTDGPPAEAKSHNNTVAIQAGCTHLDGTVVRSLIREAFKNKISIKQDDVQTEISRSFDALRTLSDEQNVFLKECISGTTTEGLRIEVTNVERESEVPAASLERWKFEYWVRLENLGTETIQLLGRYWQIADKIKTVTVPKFSPGVVGLNPMLKPGDSFVYASGTELQAHRGVMHGSFQIFRLDSEETFEAIVPPFHLIAPEKPKKNAK